MGSEASGFFNSMERWWNWNSRFWEQKALLRLAMHNKLGKGHVFTDYLRDAVAHARYAVALQLHQFPLTTLARVLMVQYDVKGENQQQLFREAFGLYDQAISMEAYKSRVTLYPIIGIMRAAKKVLSEGGEIPDDLRMTLREHMRGALSAYAFDAEVKQLIRALVEQGM